MITIDNTTAKQLVYVYTTLYTQKLTHAACMQAEAIIKIADALVRAHVVGCTGMGALLEQYTEHGYRPTLRGPLNGEVHALATLYDAIAKQRGMDARAAYTAD